MGTKTAETVRERQHPGLVDNAHWNRIAALAWALDESKRKGKKYAQQVIANAKALARALHEEGLPVKCADYGFTESHQVILDIKDEERIERFTSALEEANMIVDRGIRLGTNETTRLGMRQREMERIASMIVLIYNGDRPAGIRRLAVRLRREFNTIQYT